MKAMRIHTHGGPDVFTLDEVPTPVPGVGEILIKVAAAGINYADLMQRAGNYPLPGGLPTTLGFEAAGTVAALGAGVAGPAVGSRVVAGLGGGGGYAEYALAPAATVMPIPADLGFAEATALFVQGLTAYGLLHDAGRIQAGDTVLVHAAAGGVGSLAVQLAKLLGAGKVIATASTAEKLDLARQLGADTAINYTADDWVEQVRTATGGQGAQIILDAVGGEVGSHSVELLSQNGRLVVYGAASGAPTMLAAQQLSAKGQSVIGFSMGAGMPPEQLAAGMQALLGYIAQNQLQVTVGQTFPLAEAAAAHQAMGERKTTGKVVLLTATK